METAGIYVTAPADTTQAYLNLENSGRELESIVVGEIQKSYNAYAGILKRESVCREYTTSGHAIGVH